MGVDMFSPYYDPQQKRANLSRALTNREFTLVELDLRVGDLRPLLRGSDVVFHQAAQPGVRLSWSEHFSEYTTNNVIATQRLLEASARVNVGRVIYASSSSIYGNAARYPTVEAELPRPTAPMASPNLLLSTSAPCTPPISVCQPCHFGTLPCMDRGNVPIWRSND